MTTLLSNPGPNHRTSSGARTRIGIGLGGDEVGRGEPLEQAAPGEPVADDQARAPSRRRSRRRSRPSSSRNAARRCRRATLPRTARPTVSGAGRMNGGRPVSTTTAFQTRTNDDEGADDREPDRAAHETSSTETSDNATAASTSAAPRAGSPASGSPRWARISRPVRVTAGVVEIGDRPRPRQVDRDVGDDAAGSRREDDDAVGDQDRLGDAVGDHHDRRRSAIPEAKQLEVEAFAGERIERAERLVEEEDVRLERERAGERDPLARSRPTARPGASRPRPGRGRRARSGSRRAAARRSGGQPASSSG